MLATFSMSAPPQTQHNTAHRPPPLDVFVAFPYDSLFAAVATEDLFKEMYVIHQGIICCIWYLGVRACWVGPGLENQVGTCVNKNCFAPKQGQGVNGSYEVIYTKWCFSQMKPFEPIGTFLNHFPHLKPLSTILWSFEPV